MNKAPEGTKLFCLRAIRERVEIQHGTIALKMTPWMERTVDVRTTY